MKINYNVTGAKRKSLVGAISQELNAPTKYLGAPTFTYEVAGYTIDKNGVLEGTDNLALEDALLQKGFSAEEREYDEPDSYERGLGGMSALEQIPDIDQHHPGQYANQDAPMTGAMQKQLDDISESTRLEIEIPVDGVTDEAFVNLEKLVASKASLIKKAIGAETLPIERTESTLRFPWFTLEPGNEAAEAQAYCHFVTELCNMAKTQIRVNGIEKPVDNEKYAFRCFLLRLGFIGAEHKADRKILLSKLDGSSAFKNPHRGGTDK